MGRLNEKVAVITGGVRRIGRQIALTFAEEGAGIIIADIVDGTSVVREVQQLTSEALAVVVNVAVKEEVERLINQAVDYFGRIDILVNNAAITRHASVLEMIEKDWNAVLDVNLKGVFLCTQATAKHMVQHRYGKIINMASIAGLNAVGVSANYCVSKAGVIQFTKVCAREFGAYGINVNAIAPGVVVTDMTYARPPEEAKRFIEERRSLAVLGRTGTTQDIANLALFLASDESSFITGQVIAADGGRTGLM